jgi:hypothetical protein
VGSNSRCKVACSHCTLALEGIADYKVSSYLAAYSAALPADDVHSSCRLGISSKPIAFVQVA